MRTTNCSIFLLINELKEKGSFDGFLESSIKHIEQRISEIHKVNKKCLDKMFSSVEKNDGVEFYRYANEYISIMEPLWKAEEKNIGRGLFWPLLAPRILTELSNFLDSGDFLRFHELMKVICIDYSLDLQ
jgi:hypothetical protein